MPHTENFRQQHKDLLAIAGKMALGFRQEHLARDASEMRTLLSELTAKLKVHLAMEDKSLYPALLNHSNGLISTKAQEFVTEMGGLAEVYTKYVERWRTASLIQADPDTFITESRDVFDALADRIKREDSELYVMVESL